MRLNHLLLVGGFAAATPIPASRDAGLWNEQLTLAVVPNSLSCTSGSDECRNATQVTPLLIDAMAAYQINTPAEIAAIVSLIGFESVDFQYKHNISPGRPGQGTSNMQMLVCNLPSLSPSLFPSFVPANMKFLQQPYNIQFAQSFPELASEAEALTNDPNGLLALVTPDQYNFKSGPWFLATQCDPSVRAALQNGDDAGFAAYMACVGTDVAGRQDYWNRAKEALGL